MAQTMTHEQFTACARQTSYRGKCLSAAYYVLVADMTYENAQLLFSLRSTGPIHRIVKRIMTIHYVYQPNCPHCNRKYT